MPCTAKKFEMQRDDQDAAGLPTWTSPDHPGAGPSHQTRASINFNRLPDEDFDALMGVSTGAAAIFGATGGVMEAALRTAADVLTGKYLRCHRLRRRSAAPRASRRPSTTWAAWT